MSWYSHTVTSVHFQWITRTQSGPDDVMALCIINIERSFPLLGTHVYHTLGSISNLPQDCLGHSYYLSRKRLPNSVVKFLWKLADYFLFPIEPLTWRGNIMYHLLSAYYSLITFSVNSFCVNLTECNFDTGTDEMCIYVFCI